MLMPKAKRRTLSNATIALVADPLFLGCATGVDSTAAATGLTTTTSEYSSGSADSGWGHVHTIYRDPTNDYANSVDQQATTGPGGGTPGDRGDTPSGGPGDGGTPLAMPGSEN